MRASEASATAALPAVRQAAWLRGALGLGLAALSALLLTLAFPPYGLWPLIWLGFVPMLVAQHRLLSARLSSLAPAIAIGYFVDRPDGTWRNEATVLAPSGEFLGLYGKAHPVVFGGERNTSLGTFPVYDTPAGRLGTIICYDLDFTDTARTVTRSGAQVVAVPSLDFPGIAERHYAHLVFRAVKNRLAMVKAGGGYDSAIVDP